MNNPEWAKLKKSRLRKPPAEASQNLITPELRPGKIDGRTLRRTPRTHQFNTKVTPEFYQLLYQLAQQENRLLSEVLETALYEYAKKKKIKLNNLVKKNDYINC